MKGSGSTRRRWIKRVALGTGAVAVGIAALAVVDADHDDSVNRPGFSGGVVS